MNIYQKLIEVRKSCEYLKKDNQGLQFKYVSSSQTLGTLRAKMDEMGLLLVPSVISHEVRDHTTQKGNHSYFTILTLSFVWVNSEKPEERVESLWTGQGLDDAEKGVGKALTYAEKYYLLKFFNIATDKDDPDSFQKKHAETDQGKKEKESSFKFMCREIMSCENIDLLNLWREDNRGAAKSLSANEKKDLGALVAEQEKKLLAVCNP